MKLQCPILLPVALQLVFGLSADAFGIFDRQPSVDLFGDSMFADTFDLGFGLPRPYYRPPTRYYKFDEDLHAHYIFLNAPYAEHKSFQFQIDHTQNELTITEHAPHGFRKNFWLPKHVDTTSITAEWIRRDLLKIVLPKQQYKSQQLQERLYERQQEIRKQYQAERQQQRERRQEQAEQERQLLEQRRAERRQQLLEQQRAERQRQIQEQQRQEERRQQLHQQRQEERRQQLLQQRRQQLLQQRQSERQQFERQQKVLRQRRAELQRQILQQRKAEREQLRMSQRQRDVPLHHDRAQESVHQDQVEQHQRQQRQQRQQVLQPIEQVQKFPEEQSDGAYKDHDSDMLVAEDEENTEPNAEVVELDNAVAGYVDSRGVFREY